MSLKNKSTQELQTLHRQYQTQFEQLQSQNCQMNMARGVPNPKQIDISNEILTCLGQEDYLSKDGVDCRNYGSLDGLPEMKEIFAEMLDVSVDQVIVGGNASLNLMFDDVANNVSRGLHGEAPWLLQGKIRFLCPVPGYDRHFSICQHFGIEMIPIPLLPDGPDMDLVTRLVSSDPTIKGMWCTPKYANPEGIVYSAETVRRIANMKPAAKDFRLYWDNAYAIHSLYETLDTIPNIIEECAKAGNPNMPVEFASFSKITFGGGAVSCVASSKENIDEIRKRLSIQIIGYDKLNQLRHVRFLKNFENTKKIAQKHAAFLRPKFELVDTILTKELGELDIATWTKPRGGYFISFYSMENCAKKIVGYCKDCGLILTNAGATYPYGQDPKDQNIRIAPSYPSLEDLSKALEIFCMSVKLASIESLLEKNNC